MGRSQRGETGSRRRTYVVAAAALLVVATILVLSMGFAVGGPEADDSAASAASTSGAAVDRHGGVFHEQVEKESGVLGEDDASVKVVADRDRAAPRAVKIPPRLAKVLGPRHCARTVTSADDELLRAANWPVDFLDKYEGPLGNPQVDPADLRRQMEDAGFAKIPNMLHKKVARELRMFIMSLLNEEGAQWNPNEGDRPNDANTTLGRVCMGLAPKFYAPLDRIVNDPNTIRYMSALMPCQNSAAGQEKYRITQIFMTVNDRIRWHVDYPNQPPYAHKRTTMYDPDYCQYKTIFYLQDHTAEDAGNPSALMVVPHTHLAEPHWTNCDRGSNCSIARKGKVPSREYTSVNLQPDLGDLLVMDARSLHTAADYSLTLPTAPKPTPRKHKYRVFLQFLYGIDHSPQTDAMQKKKDKNLTTKYFKKKVFP